MFSQIFFMLKEMCKLIKKEKVYFIAPILIIFALLGFFIIQVGPAAVTAFIYAGF